LKFDVLISQETKLNKFLILLYEIVTKNMKNRYFDLFYIVYIKMKDYNSLESLDCFFSPIAILKLFRIFSQKKPRSPLRGFGLVLCLEMMED
jgi:hypothetical protein